MCNSLNEWKGPVLIFSMNYHSQAVVFAGLMLVPQVFSSVMHAAYAEVA